MGPKQVAIANEVFSATVEEIARATHIKRAFESNAAHQIHGFMDEKYGFIDEPIYKDALLLLSQL
jgi:citrate lyase subunit beta/citryl-CoA lyase